MARTFALFVAKSASGADSLWMTDGTATGTYEIEPISGMNAGGSADYSIHSFAGGALFYSAVVSVNLELAFSNGTAGGTSILPTSSWQWKDGLRPTNVIAFADSYLFGSNAHLWSTDGTQAGTQDLGITSPVASGFNTTLLPGNGVVVNGRLICEAASTTNSAPFNRREDIAVSDGTTAGTSIISLSGNPVAPTDFTALGNGALFRIDDKVWITDGTQSGTHALLSGAGTAVQTAGLPPIFAATANGVVFLAVNAQFRPGLWITDGTQGGTHELNIAGASASGLFGSSYPNNDPDFVSYHGMVLFRGLGLNGPSLWITDGTAANTFELTGIAGAYAGGINPSGMQVFGDVVMFQGTDALGRQTLWTTDGTAAGTHFITDIGGQTLPFIRGITIVDMPHESLYGASAGGTLHGGAGDDYLDAGDGAYAMYGGRGYDTLVGHDAAASYLSGGIGNDSL